MNTNKLKNSLEEKYTYLVLYAENNRDACLERLTSNRPLDFAIDICSFYREHRGFVEDCDEITLVSEDDIEDVVFVEPTTDYETDRG